MSTDETGVGPVMRRARTRERNRLVQQKAWANLVAPRATDFSKSELARLVGVDRASMLRWLSGDVAPDPWSLQGFSQVLGVPVVDQLIALGWLREEHLAAGGARSELISGDADREFRELASTLGELTNRVSGMARPAFAVLRAILEPPPELGSAWRGRWQARASMFKIGVEYPTDWGLIAEFIRNRSAQPYSPRSLASGVSAVPRFRQYAESARHPVLFDDQLDDPTWEIVKAERLELLTLLSAEPLAAYGYWAGEQGVTWLEHATLNDRSPRPAYTHLYYPDEQMRSMARTSAPQELRTSHLPQPRLRQRPPTRSVQSVVVIGFSFHIGHVIGRLVAEAIGWGFRNTNQITIEKRRGAPLRGWRDPETRSILRAVCVNEIESARDGRLDKHVLSITAIDAIRSPEVLRSLESTFEKPYGLSPLIVFVRPNKALSVAWEHEQLDSRWLGDAGAAAHNDAELTDFTSEQLLGLLERREDAHSFLTIDLCPRQVELGNEFRLVDPAVSDWCTRAAYAVLRLLGAENLEATSHLGRFEALLREQWASDPTWDGQLVVSRPR